MTSPNDFYLLNSTEEDVGKKKTKPGRDLRHLLLISGNILFHQGLGASLVAQMVKHLPACRRPELNR